MNKALSTLSGRVYELPEMADTRAEAAYEARCKEMQNGEFPDCDEYDN